MFPTTPGKSTGWGSIKLLALAALSLLSAGTGLGKSEQPGPPGQFQSTEGWMSQGGGRRDPPQGLHAAAAGQREARLPDDVCVRSVRPAANVFSIDCRDPAPTEISRAITRQAGEVWDDDAIALILDTFNDACRLGRKRA